MNFVSPEVRAEKQKFNLLNDFHLFHQESGVFIPGNTFADAVIKIKMIILDSAFKAIVPDPVRVGSFKLAQLQVVRSNHAQAVVLQEMLYQAAGAGELVFRIGAFQNFI